MKMVMIALCALSAWSIKATGEEISGPGKDSENYELFVVKSPITDERLLPTASLEDLSASENVDSSRTLSLVACRGEYEPASFVIYAQQDLHQINIATSDLGGKGTVIPAKSIDIRTVKCWYQAGIGTKINREERTKYLTPELLLKNDDLIQVDYAAKVNSPIDYKTIKDAEELQPFDIPAKSLKQIWVTVHVPEGISPGDYEGTIDVLPSNGVSAQLKLVVKVLPFKLEEPRLEYCIYYHGQLTEQRTLGPFYKSAVQMLADFRYMKAHGIDNPSLTSSSVNFSPAVVKQVLELRRKAGMDNKTILYGGDPALPCVGASNGPEQLEQLKELVRERIKVFKDNGVSEVYFYGIDEATGEMLKAERSSWQAVHEEGGKMWGACFEGFFEVVGDLLDSVVYFRAPDAEMAQKVHTYPGHKIYGYAIESFHAGHLGTELPYSVRSNYGLNFWKAGYDGVCEYSYQHPVPWARGFDSKGTTLWDDFDTFEDLGKVPDVQSLRDFVMAYPTIDGVVPTVQGEGFREAVDDVRYITTLEKTLQEVKTISSLNTPARETERWLKNLDVKGASLQNIRRETVERIMKLKALAWAVDNSGGGDSKH